MEIDWNVTPINGTNRNCFFTRESYALYSVQPSFIGTLDLETSDGGVQLHTNNVRDSSSRSGNPKSDINVDKKKNPEAAVPSNGTAVHVEVSSKNKMANDKKPAKWMQAKMGLKVLYPRPSNMTKLEQKTYIELFDRFRHLPPRNQEDYKLLSRLKELQTKVTAEQEEYMAYLEGIAREFVADYNTVHPVVEKFVLEYLEKRRRNVYRYPRRYILHDTVPLVPSKGQLDVSLAHISTLLEMGTVAKMVLPNLGESGGGSVTKVPMDFNRVSKRYPQCLSEPSGTAAGEYTKVPISSDVNLDHLLMKYEADLAITLGAFQCLIDNYPHNYNRQWELAVTVKEYDVNVSNQISKRKVICVDSPFIPKTITPLEKNLTYYKLALKTMLLHPNHHNACPLEMRGDYFSRNHKPEGDCLESGNSENVFSDAVDDLSSLEVFGTEMQKDISDKCLVTDDLAVSGDSDTGDSNAVELSVESAMTDAKVCDISTVSANVTPASPSVLFDVMPLSPIACLDGLVDEKPAGHEAEGTEGGCSSSRRGHQSSRSQKKSADSGPSGSAGSGTSVPRRSLRLASRGRAPEFDLTDSDSDGNLIIDCMSPKERSFSPKFLSDSVVQSKSPQRNRMIPPEVPHDMSKVICTQNPIKDSSLAETVAYGMDLDTPSTCYANCTSVQPLVEAEAKETKTETELMVLQSCSQPDSLEESDMKPASDSLVDESCGTLDMSLSESMVGSCSSKMEDMEIQNPLSSLSSQTSSTGVIENAMATEITDGKPAKMKRRGRKRNCSTAGAASTEVKIENAVPVPSVSVSVEAKRARGRPRKVEEPVTRDLSLCDLGSGDGKLTGKEEVTLLREADGTKTKNESEIGSLSLATPNDQTVGRDPSEKSISQKSRKQLLAPSVSKSSSNDSIVQSVSPASKQSTNDQSVAVPSFLDQLLSDQSKMFDRNVAKSSLQLGPSFGVGSAVRTSALSISSAATVTVSSEKRQLPMGLVDDHAVDGPTSVVGDCAQPISSGTVAPAELMSENPAEYVRPSVGNVAYHLWSLGGLKFILRHHYHGVYRPYRHKLPYFMHIQPKLEHQAEHGVEQMTPSEAIRSWTALQLKLRTRLLRTHINTSSSEVLLFENLSQNPLLQKANPSASLVSVHLLLERLTKLAVGTYLIGHMPGSQHIQIKKTTQAERGVYDLHLAYQSTETLLNQPTSSASYWLPIDPSIRLRYHNKYFRIPCTFEPKDTAMVNTAQQGNFRKNTKKKGRKN